MLKKTNLSDLSALQLRNLIFAGLCGSVVMTIICCLLLKIPPHPSVLIGSFAVGFTIGIGFWSDEIAQLWLLGGAIGAIAGSLVAIFAIEKLGIFGGILMPVLGAMLGAVSPYGKGDSI